MAVSRLLYLLRHGEAKPGIGPLGDLKRPLSEAGEFHINQLSKVLESRKITFDLILVSPAVRTSQTAKILSKSVSSKEILVLDEIYDAELNDLVKILNDVDSGVQNLLLVGHNPSLSLLVSYLTGIGSLSLNPGMMAIIEIVSVEWKQMGKGTGILKEVI